MAVEKIVTDQLDGRDWNILLSLDLKPVHRAYIREFFNRNNRPSNLWEFQEYISRYLGEVPKLPYFDQVSAALRKRNVPYRIRAKGKGPHSSNHRIVKVK